jgi:hypothetical protein
MKLTKHSENRLLESMNYWRMSRDYAEPLYNYLVHGFEPGSFFFSLLANDAIGAISHSHSGNTIPALKTVTGWMLDKCPRVAWGSHKNVVSWIKMSDNQRREVLEDWGLIYTEEEEIMLILKNERTVEPLFI